MGTYNLNEQVLRSIRIMKYDRSKTIHEQTVPMNTYLTTKQEKEDGKYGSGDPCENYVSPEFCKSTFGQDSICPGTSNDFELKNHCYYLSVDKKKIYGVDKDDTVTFVDGTIFRNFYKSLNGEDNEFLKTILYQAPKEPLETVTNNIKNTLLKELKLSGLSEMVSYINDELLPLGTIFSIVSEGKTYNLKFGVKTMRKMLSAPVGLKGDELKNYIESASRVPTYLYQKGYYDNNGKEYETPNSADLRSGFDRFIDEWGVIIQVLGAIGAGVAGYFTGGSTWALAAEIIVELGLASSLAYRALERGDSWGAGVEVLFGLLPFIKTSKLLSGISNETFKSLSNKWHNISNAQNMTASELGQFWVSLTDEEAKALAKIIRQEEVILRQLKNILNEPLDVVKAALEIVDSVDEAKQVITTFAKSSAGRELGATGILLAIDLAKTQIIPYNQKQLNTIEFILNNTTEEMLPSVVKTLMNLDDDSTPEEMVNTIMDTYPEMKEKMSTWKERLNQN